MKKFVFSLERMLVYQQQNLEKEKGILEKLTAARDELEELKNGQETRIAHIQKEIKKRQAEGTTVFILKGCFAVLEGARLQLEDTQKELSQAQARVEKQRRIVTEASKEVKKLEKLKENQLEEYHHDEAKEQQDMITEHVAGAFVRNGVS
ncbi:flagellar FliJ family protein [Enterocloster aldenensis]|uniref:flagellar FliJ family protein n=1 Tax=Enterocloster aldenensis TaxID=358742 RepID=UPI0040297D96